MVSTINADDWSVDANEALKLSLFIPKTNQEIEFSPVFTYPLYGETQAIYGYKDLKVRLLFAADDMKPCVGVTWAEKVPRMGDVEAEDVVKPLRDLLPESAFSQDSASFMNSLKARTKPFTPPGVLHATLQHHERTYEVWRSSVGDARCREMLVNMQILIPLYIEGGAAIELDDEEWSSKRWEVFFLYEKTVEGLYSFIGYCTLYRYFFFNKLVADQSRIRLSQFLILPPYQQMGHGSRFYDIILQHYLDASEVREITVEDPSEEFGDLRDRRDMLRLARNTAFANIKLSDIAAKKVPLKEIRESAKMPERQFLRCVELKLLQSLDERDKKTHKAYRLFIKSRIYKQHADVLAQLDRLERIDKLDETFHHVEDDYKRLLRAMEHDRVEDDSSNHKRVADESGVNRPSKRARVEGGIE